MILNKKNNYYKSFLMVDLSWLEKSQYKEGVFFFFFGSKS